jgi:replicative DNA helicase
MSEEIQKNWASHKDFYEEALLYMEKRAEGKISSFKTPWPKINDAGIFGFEYNSIIIIAARPGGGKTLMKDQLIREGFKINSGQGIRALEFQFEMVGRNSKIREFSAVSKKTYKYLCSAETEGITVSKELIEKCRKYSASASKYPIDIVDKPGTVKVMRETIINYMDYHKKRLQRYPKTVITLDHSVLVKKDKGQQTTEMLNALGEMATELKKAYPIIFIILSQLNREIDAPHRCENGKHGNYPNPNDIFGADALNQHADMVIILDRPALRYISEYGPERFLIEDDTTLAAHVVKTRTGDRRISFFEANFGNMSIESSTTPPQAPPPSRNGRKQ